MPGGEWSEQVFNWHPTMLEYGTRPFYDRGTHTCVASTKVFEPVGILLLERLKHQVINLALQADKDLRWPIPEVKMS